MKQINTAHASGTTLDWLVAKAEGLPVEMTPGSTLIKARPGIATKWNPMTWPALPSYSTNPAQAHAIIEREAIATFKSEAHAIVPAMWGAFISGNADWVDTHITDEIQGRTMLEAAMRCYVASKLGETAEVPDELMP